MFLRDDMKDVTLRLLRDYGGEIYASFGDALAAKLENGNYKLKGEHTYDDMVPLYHRSAVLPPF